jgi:hypothetical protein
MNKYLILYRTESALDGPSVAEMFAQATPAQMEAGMALWRAWYAKCGSAVVDPGAPLDKSFTITKNSEEQGKTPVTGYTILQAGSHGEAISLVKDHPHLHAPHSSVQVLECISMPGM